MQVSIESTEGLERKMTVRIPAERIEGEVQKRLRDLSRRVKLDGFRPGKVPMKLIQQRYGNSVYQDVVGEMMQTTFREALAQEKISPAGAPQIELESSHQEGELSYTATFEVYPEITLNPIEELSLTRPIAEVTEADVDEMIETLRKQRRTWEAVDRPAEAGDQVVIDFKGTLEGEPFEGGEAEDYALVLGEGRLIDGFESQLEGVSAEEQRSIEVTFPQDYHAQDLAGKTVVFDVKVKAVRSPVLPEVDEEFARSFGIEEGGVDALRVEVRKNMERELKQALKERLKTRVMDALFENNRFDVPKALIQDEIHRMRSQVGESMAPEARENLPDSLFEDQARRRVSLGLIVAELIRSEKIVLDPERLEATLRDLAEGYEDPEEVVRFYRQNKNAMNSIEALVLEDQVVERVASKAKVEDEQLSFAQVMNPATKA